MKSLVRTLYNKLVRPYTPQKIAVFNGVPVRGIRLFDATDVFRDYEAALIAAIREQINEGDEIVVVGGGRGISTVSAARCAGVTGRVTTYEGSAERVETVRETVSLSDVQKRVNVNHAIVAEAVKLAADPGEAPTVSPSDMPSCDVLVLDCEGAEIKILNHMSELPSIVIVETHGFLNASEEEIREILSNRGYKIVERRVEDGERGIHVLTSVREQ